MSTASTSMSPHYTTSPSSMTGFAKGQKQIGEQLYICEVKTLNHRFLDVKLKTPKTLQSIDQKIKDTVQTSFVRGSIDIRIERTSENQNAIEVDSVDFSLHPTLNMGLAAHYFEQLKSVQKLLGLESSPTLSDLMKFPDLIIKQENYKVDNDIEKSILELVTETCNEAVRFRLQEGSKISNKVLNQISEILEIFSKIELRRQECISHYRQKISTRVKELFLHYRIENLPMNEILESRIHQELAILLDRTDIHEEIERFKNHLLEFKATLLPQNPISQNKSGIGKKLDFLTQELGREINTLGNKAQDYLIGKEVVQIKVLLEQMREQLMNLE